MNGFSRRRVLMSAAATAVALRAGPAFGQSHAHGMFSHLHEPGFVDLPAEAEQQHSVDSPAPAAADQGRWLSRAALPLPRSEMAWATAWEGGLHLVGGYGEQRVDTAHHHVYLAAEDRWVVEAPLPRGGNHVGVVATDGKLYAVGGHQEQNRRPYADCFVRDLAGGAWRRIAPLPEPCGAISMVALGGLIHAIGGAIGDTSQSKRSVDWHHVYDPSTDTWSPRAPLPVGRDHMGAVVVDDRIHVIAGRVDSARNNVDHHDVYLPAEDRWDRRAPLPTPRSGHGAVLYRGRIFVMGGEEFVITRAADGTQTLGGTVFGQNESYDPATDRWESHAPMPTPRHGLGAAVVGGMIHVVGGGPVVGGRIQSAVHEAFTLG